MRVPPVVPLGAATARRAGGLLARAKLRSAHAVDAFVVATAMEFGSACIATHDPDDITKLASAEPRVAVFAL